MNFVNVLLLIFNVFSVKFVVAYFIMFIDCLNEWKNNSVYECEYVC